MSAPIDVGPCPFCGQSLLAEPVGYMVLHGLPACPEYMMDEDALAFMIRCREEKQRQLAALGGSREVTEKHIYAVREPNGNRCLICSKPEGHAIHDADMAQS